jgi:FlaA1/EpsC-like NDP-sugar epimerase
LIEVVVDFALITGAFTAAYFIRLEGSGAPWQRHVFNVSLPALLVARYIFFVVFGLYRGVWRYAGARDAATIFGAVLASETATFLFIWATVPWGGFPRGIYAVDILVCSLLIGVSRFWERGIAHALRSFVGRGAQRRTLIVGAGQSGRSLLRELRESRDVRVIGFVDDNPALRHRRIQGVPVVGSLSEIGWVVGRYEPDAVLVTILGAPRASLDGIVEACSRADVNCRFVRRQIDLDPAAFLTTAAE